MWICRYNIVHSIISPAYHCRSSLPLLVFGVVRTDDIHVALSPHALSSMMQISHGRPNAQIREWERRTLQPSQSFFTELRTFIPRCGRVCFEPLTSAVCLELLSIDGARRTPDGDDRSVVENDWRCESLDAEVEMGSHAEESGRRSWARDLDRRLVRETIGTRTAAIGAVSGRRRRTVRDSKAT
jgi:hypothetical protein